MSTRKGEGEVGERDGERIVTISGQSFLIGFLVLVAIGLVAWRVSLSSEPANPVIPDEVVAKVNGEQVMRSEILHQLEKIPLRLKGKVTFDEVLNATIRERVLVQEARKEGIEVPREEARAYLALMLNRSGMTDEDLQERARGLGVPESEIVDILHRRLLVNALLEKKVFLAVEVSGKEIQDFFEEHKNDLAVPEQVHVKHILLAQSEEANATLDRISRGAEFEVLAKDLSLDKASARHGGDVGNISRGQTIPEFEQASFSAKSGSIIGPIKSAYGYHLIKIVGTYQARNASLKDLHDTIEGSLKVQKSEKASNEYVDMLQSRARIELVTTLPR